MVEWEHPSALGHMLESGDKIHDIWIHFRLLNNIEIGRIQRTIKDFKICLHTRITNYRGVLLQKIVLNRRL